MLASVRTITQLVADEVDAGIPSNRIIVGGFSQGSAISLLTGITSERRLAGLICLSGWLGLAEKTAAMQTDHAKNLPIFWGHGELGSSDALVFIKLHSGAEFVYWLQARVTRWCGTRGGRSLSRCSRRWATITLISTRTRACPTRSAPRSRRTSQISSRK